MAELKDLLLKIANNARLTPLELDELGRFGTETQKNNAFIAGLQSGAASINVNQINVQKITSGNQSMSGAIFNAYGSVTAAQLPSSSNITNWTVKSGESLNGFSLSGQYIYVPEPGLYRIKADVQWAHAATGTRRTDIVWHDNSKSYAVDGTHSLSGAYGLLYQFGVNQAYIDKDGIYMFATQSSGSDLDVSIGIYVERIGQWRKLNS